jgi:hypothetical protein
MSFRRCKIARLRAAIAAELEAVAQDASHEEDPVRSRSGEGLILPTYILASDARERAHGALRLVKIAAGLPESD